VAAGEGVGVGVVGGGGDPTGAEAPVVHRARVPWYRGEPPSARPNGGVEEVPVSTERCRRFTHITRKVVRPHTHCLATRLPLCHRVHHGG
jgi:hypothetical protein